MPDTTIPLAYGEDREGGISSTSFSPQSSSNSINSNSAAISQELKINVDHFLSMVLSEWKKEQKRRETHLLDIFRGVDVNGDGKLTASEFIQIVHSIDPQREEGEILLIFSDALRRSMQRRGPITSPDSLEGPGPGVPGPGVPGRITPDIFLMIAKEYDLDELAWNEDGNLRNITNDFESLEATWIQVRTFFIGTFEALVRDLDRNHFLKTCEGTGCGCLECILNAYIDFQRMRKEYTITRYSKSPHRLSFTYTPYNISESLLWGRFWYLMRQLYEATLESDGVMSPWKGCDVIVRVEPAPPLAPRTLSKRRGAIPIFLFPDTNRVAGKMSLLNQEEIFEPEIIRSHFPELFS
jgi:hypothetical protein